MDVQRSTSADDQLRADAQAWRIPPAPDLERMARNAVTGHNRRPRHTLLVASAALVVAALTGVLLFVRVGGDSNPDPAAAGVPASIVVHGHTIPLAGTIPWDSAIIDHRHPLRLTIYADADRIHGDACGLPKERAYAQLADDRIVIVVAGFAHPLPPRTSCAAVGHAPQRLTVQLPTPIPAAGLLDPTTGEHHTALDPRTVPMITAPPALCRPTSVTWNDLNQKTVRDYRASPTYSQHHCLIEFTYGHPYVAHPNDIAGTSQGTASIHGHRAEVSLYRVIHNHEWTIRWQPSTTHGIELVVNSDPKHPFTEKQVLGIARSIR